MGRCAHGQCFIHQASDLPADRLRRSSCAASRLSYVYSKVESEWKAFKSRLGRSSFARRSRGSTSPVPRGKLLTHRIVGSSWSISSCPFLRRSMGPYSSPSGVPDPQGACWVPDLRQVVSGSALQDSWNQQRKALNCWLCSIRLNSDAIQQMGQAIHGRSCRSTMRQRWVRRRSSITGGTPAERLLVEAQAAQLSSRRKPESRPSMGILRNRHGGVAVDEVVVVVHSVLSSPQLRSRSQCARWYPKKRQAKRVGRVSRHQLRPCPDRMLLPA